jgi:hypothetical protein
MNITYLILGYLTPVTDLGKIFCVFYILIGVPLTYIIFYNIAERLEYFIINGIKKSSFKKYYSINQNEEDRPIYFLNGKPNNKNTIYVKCFSVFLFLIIFIYILPSVVISEYLETDWSFLDSIYYCYISISTIGFGS